MTTTRRFLILNLMCCAGGAALLGCSCDDAAVGCGSFAAPMAIIIAIIWLSHRFSRKERTMRSLRTTEATPIGSVRDGEVVKIVGAVELESGPLTAPLTGRRCAWYVADVEEYEGSGESAGWKNTVNEERSQPFFVRDATGGALVSVEEARAVLVSDRRGQVSLVDAPSAELKEFLARHGRHPAAGVKWSEGVIEAGEAVAVVGIGRWEGGPAATGAPYRDRATPRLLRMTGTKEQPLLVSDYRETRAVPGAHLPPMSPTSPDRASGAPRVLVVDSDAAPAVTITSTLGRLGLCVDIVAHGDAALAAARSTSPALIIVGADPADVSGFVTCKMIRKEAGLAGIPVIILSASEEGFGMSKHAHAEEYAVGMEDLAAKARRLLRLDET